jgi:heme/copper-type cytochrome/quinol oxidase subunit 4
LNWITISIGIIIGIIVFVIIVFLRFYNNRNIGKKFFVDNEKPLNRVAPSMYYDKQMMYRKSYGFFIGVHYILVVMSISLTVITIYMVMDTELNRRLRLIVSVLAAVSTNLQIVLRFDKVAEGYICAMRVLEQAILEYEEKQGTSLDILLQANIKAEEIIHNMFQ